MMTYTHKGTKCYQTCLGIYLCSVDGCSFVANASYPKSGRVKFCSPDQPVGKNECSVHHRQLVHKPCKATTTLFRTNDRTKVTHKGNHDHARPHEKASKKAIAWLENTVNVNSKVVPNQIVRGTGTRSPTRNIHPALNNLDVVSYHMNRVCWKSKL